MIHTNGTSTYQSFKKGFNSCKRHQTSHLGRVCHELEPIGIPVLTRPACFVVRNHKAASPPPDFLPAVTPIDCFIRARCGIFSLAVKPLTPEPDCRSDYREFRVPLPLYHHLVCFWTQSITGSRGVYSHTVLPDACVDVVFINNEAPLLVGPWQESFITNFPPGTKILGVRFHPGRAAPLLKLPATDLLNLCLPLQDVSGRSLSKLFASVLDQPSLRGRRVALEAVMAGWLLPSAPADSDGALESAMRWLARRPGEPIDRLCQEMAISPRQLHRRFLAAVGLGPKLFQSVMRFQRLLDLACSSPSGFGLAGLAADAGYADQPHMTREVRRFSGKPPGVLLGSRRCTLGMSELFGANAAAF